MNRLIRAELRRFRSRTLLWLIALGMLGVAVLVVVPTVLSGRPPSAEDLAIYEQVVAEQTADWEVNGEQYVADCVASEEQEREINPEVDFGCDQMRPPTIDDFIFRTTFETSVPSFFQYLGLFIAGGAGLMAVTFVAAEFSTGSMGMWLTYEPRRIRVYASKVVAAATSVLPPALVSIAVVVGGAWIGFRAFGSLGDTGPELWGDVAASSGRVLVLAVIAAAVGAALAFVVRSTAGVLGVALGWAIVVEGILRGMRQSLAPVTASVNMDAWVQGGTSYFTTVCQSTPTGGRTCEGVEHVVSMTQGGLVMGGAAVVLTAVAVLVFRRRDVS